MLYDSFVDGAFMRNKLVMDLSLELGAPTSRMAYGDVYVRRALLLISVGLIVNLDADDFL